MAKNRILWIDWLKAVFIYVVVLYHCKAWNFYIQATFPTFFAIAGYLFDPGRYSFKQFARRRCRQVLVPYLVFGVIFYALWLVMALVHSHRTGEAVNYLKPLLELCSGYPTTIVGAYWFANALLVMQLLYYALLRWVPARWHLPVTMLVSAVNYYLFYTEFWALTNVALYMPFYVFGVQCKGLLSRQHLDTGLKRLLGLLAIIAIVWLLSYAYCHFDRGLHNVLMLVLQFGVVTFTFWLAQWWAQVCHVQWLNRCVTFIASGAIIYLAVQNDVILYLGMVAQRVLHLTVSPALGVAISVATMIVAALIVCIFPLNRIIYQHSK